MIHLENGKRYRCANGRYAVIGDDYDWKGELRFVALIQGRATPEWYTADGSFRGRSEGDDYASLRIVAEWHEPVEAWALVNPRGEIDDIFDDEPRAKAAASSNAQYRVAKLVEVEE